MINNDKDHTLSKFGVIEAKDLEKCLGLLAIVGRSKKKAFDYLINKVEKAKVGWKYKLFSKGGREVLLKAVAQAVLTYTSQSSLSRQIYVVELRERLIDIGGRTKKWVQVFGGKNGLIHANRRIWVAWSSDTCIISTKRC